MKQRIVAGNWKMHTRRGEASDLVAGILHHVGQLTLPDSLDVVVCPPFVWIEQTVAALHGARSMCPSVHCGAQDCHEEISGAYTGDVSAQMIADIGCDYVIVGHSERRQYYGESNSRVARKLRAALAAGLRPIVCVGESADERTSGRTVDVVTQQINELVDGAGADALNASVIAYEPLWAIGTGVAASPEQAQEVHHTIRVRLTELSAPSTPILYGGSVNALNASAYFQCADIDGALVGGASLNADVFVSIVSAAVAAWNE